MAVASVLRPEPLFRLDDPEFFRQINDLTDRAKKCNWTVEKIDMGSDKWEALPANTQHFVSHVLAFFAAADGIVNENLVFHMVPVVTKECPEALDFYFFQIFMESIHATLYSRSIIEYIHDLKERARLFNATTTIPVITRKAKWALKWIESTEATFVTSLIAFAVVEGIFFSGSFCALYWLKSKGLLPGLTESNEYIARDEGMHMLFACLLYRYLRDQLPVEQVLEIVKEAVEIEKEFVSVALPVGLIGMNPTQMCEHIEYIADCLLMHLGLEKHYHTKNPFVFFELISLQGKTNFFERRVTDYKTSLTSRSNSSEGNDNNTVLTENAFKADV